MQFTYTEQTRRAAAYRRHRLTTLWARFTRLADKAGITYDTPPNYPARLAVIAAAIGDVPGWYVVNAIEAGDLASVRHKADHFTPFAVHRPSNAVPGSPAKLRDLALRVAMGCELFHPDDRTRL